MPTSAAATTSAVEVPAGAWMSATVMPPSAIVARIAPPTSSRPAPSASRLSGTWRSARNTTTTPIGRLIRKIARQLETSTSQPPSRGPIAAAIDTNPVHAPIARARSSGTKAASMIARLPGVSSAPPTPCSARAAISTPTDGATAHSAEATVNQAMPITNTRRRPMRSPSAPPNRISEASVSM